MKILIIDDDKDFSLIFKKDLSNFLYQTYENIIIDIINESFHDIKNGHDYDLIFIDIDLDYADGISLSKTLNDNSSAIIVFVSSKSSLVHDTLEVHPFFFIRKGFYTQDLNTFFKLFIDSIEQRKMITVQYKYEKATIFFKDIQYIESKEHVMNFYIKNDVILHDNRSLSCLSTILPENKFIRIHNAYIINMDYLDKYTSNFVVLNCNSILPIGRKYKKYFNQKYKEYLLL